MSQNEEDGLRVWATESSIEIRHIVLFLIFAASLISMPWYVSHLVAWVRS